MEMWNAKYGCEVNIGGLDFLFVFVERGREGGKKEEGKKEGGF